MMTEFMALGNHRKSIRAEIAAVTEGVRKVQLDALVAKFGKNARPGRPVSLPALQLLISGLPKFLNLEEGIGVKSAHKEVTVAFEQYFDIVEQPAKPKHKPRNGARASPNAADSGSRGQDRVTHRMTWRLLDVRMHIEEIAI